MVGSQRVRMMMEFDDGQRAVEHHVMNRVAQVAQSAAEPGNQLAFDDDAPVLVTFGFGRLADGQPK